MAPDKRHIYNSSSQVWSVSCFSQDVHLADGWHSEENDGLWKLEPGGGVCVYFTGPSNSRRWRPEPGYTPRGINPKSFWVYGSANITISGGEEFKMLLVGKSPSRWTPIYLGAHRFANRNLGDKCQGDLNLLD